jgi:hypothetical protein
MDTARDCSIDRRINRVNGSAIGARVCNDIPGKRLYPPTISAGDLPGIMNWQSDARLEIQFVANGKDGQPLARSEVYRKVTLMRCMQK